jgi:two-component system, chemotaxis family, sensor kinase CheA
MNIRHRITILVGLSFIAIASIGSYSFLQSRKSAVDVRSVTEGVVPSVLASADLVSQVKEVQLATLALVSAPDGDVASQANAHLQEQKTQLQAGLDLQAKHADSDAQKGLVTQARDSLANYFAAIDDTAKLKLAGKTELAEANLYASVAQYQREIGGIVNTLRIEKSRSKDAAITRLNENMARAATAISVATVVIVIILAAIGALLYRQITRPISRMQEMMSEIASSQDFTRRVPMDQEDEIGRSIMAFNSMLGKIQESSVLLRQKTNDIQSMLQNIPQGILTIVDATTVHPEYSAHLETILETREIAGRNVMDLIFSHTNLGADVLSQVEAVSGACIGEDVMNFEFNAHLMVHEIEKKMPDGRVKILDLSWSPICDDAGVIVRLMLCVRDVTELRKLAAEANERKYELEIIGEILSVTQEKFHDFVTSSIKFINENELLIRDHAQHDSAVITQLFRNMHTIKGNARTYGLNHLTNIVHEAEHTYDRLRTPTPDMAWDQAQMLEQLDGVRSAVERYARINEVSLGRKGPGRRGSVERYLMIDKVQIQETLHRLETVNPSSLHDLAAACEAVRKVLRLLGTEPITETLSGILESLPSLAAELGKASPNVHIEDNGFVLRNQASGMLKNVFMHLIRNAMDHGLETPAKRVEQGKAAVGQIRLTMNVADGKLTVRLVDDGRGLALGHIRRLAIEKGLVSADAQLDDIEIAQQIFKPGFSTAEKVTEVSGRGVGMDAVRAFLKRDKCDIDIRFTDDAVGADFRQFETIIVMPDSFAEHADGVYLPHAQSGHDSGAASGSTLVPGNGVAAGERFQQAKTGLRVV